MRRQFEKFKSVKVFGDKIINKSRDVFHAWRLWLRVSNRGLTSITKEIFSFIAKKMTSVLWKILNNAPCRDILFCSLELWSYWPDYRPAEFRERSSVAVCESAGIKETGHDGNEKRFLSKHILLSDKMKAGRKYRLMSLLSPESFFILFFF